MSATNIITRMNTEHRDSLIRLLEQQHSISLSTARQARLKNMTLNSLELTTGSNDYAVPLDPPLKDWSEAPTRLAAMDQEAMKALGRDPIAVKHYLPPQTAFNWGIMAFSALTMGLFLRRSHFTPGPDSVFKPLADQYPGAFSTCWKMQPWIISLAVGIHLIEAATLHVTKLRKHAVPTFSLVWWLWVVSAFIEGLPSFARINGYVEGERMKRSKRS